MNSLYHHFTIGFNFWYVFAPLFAVIIVPISLTNVKVRKSGRPYLAWKQSLYDIIAGVFAIAIGVMMFVESWVGAVQLFDNRLSRYESGVWSLFAATFGILFLTTVYGVLLHEISVRVQAIYLGKLKREFKQKKRAHDYAVQAVFGSEPEITVNDLDQETN